MCREGAMQVTKAAKDQDVRLVAIAKERLGHEEFSRDYWPPPAELYFDTVSEGYPFFKATNGQSLGLMRGVVNYFLGGDVKTNINRSANIKGDYQGEGTILGSVLVVSSTGEVLFHHTEKVWGDHPDDDALKAAIAQL